MEHVAKDLANELIMRLKDLSPGKRLIVGIAGIPASGKTSLAQLIVKTVNSMATAGPNSSQSDAAILVGLDGWHLTRDQLRAMPDPKLAFDRRGAHWTFDPISYLAFVKLLREPISEQSSAIKAPSFDHAVKDPSPESIHIFPSHRIVVIEGLYVLLSEKGWKEAAELLDERWLIDVNVEEARQRLVKRHVVTGVAADEKEAYWRADENDMPNGIFLLQNMIAPTKRIQSLDDPVLSGVL